MLAGDFLDNLSDQERSMYVGGILDAMAYADHSDAAYKWYYQGLGPQLLTSVLRRNRSLPVVGIIQQLVNRQR